MARIPRYPYRVVVTVKNGQNGYRPENHNYENLVAAMSYRDIALQKPLTRRVEVMMVLDESTPSHCSGTDTDQVVVRAFRS
jgi:hypothetical protein